MPTKGQRIPNEVRFWKKVDKHGPLVHRLGRCWIWKGTPTSRYGRFTFMTSDGPPQGRAIQAHRYSYESLVGPIPEGLTLDHLCSITHCVNPDHLEPVTGGENSLRGNGPAAINKRRTRCKYGHPLSGQNLYIRKDTGDRQCRTCRKVRVAHV